MSKIQRWGLNPAIASSVIIHDERGEFVLFADVAHLLAPKAPPGHIIDEQGVVRKVLFHSRATYFDQVDTEAEQLYLEPNQSALAAKEEKAQ